MTQKYLFADESGNFDFSPKGSRFFILVTVAMDCGIGNNLLDLRRELAWKGVGLDSDLHASEAPQHVRDHVFEFIRLATARVDCTILEKRKAYPGIRPTEERFYQTAWFRHMQYVAGRVSAHGDELMVVSASVGTKKKKAAFHTAVTDAVKQTTTSTHRVACWSAGSDPCLQIADFCAWAVQRKWEGGDTRSYDIIRGKIRTEFDLFKHGYMTYY